MGRKLKYRDVVKKQNVQNFQRNKAKGKFGKKNHQKSLHKNQTSTKKKLDSRKRKLSETINTVDIKEQKIDKVNLNFCESESESEDETVDPMMQLRDTFAGNALMSSANFVVSESDSESEKEEKQNDQNDFPTEVESEEEEHDRLNKFENKDTVQEEAELDHDTEIQEGEANSNSKDPFIEHLSYELHPKLLETLENSPVSFEDTVISWDHLKKICFQTPKFEANVNSEVLLLNDKTLYAVPPKIPKKANSKIKDNLFIKSQISQNLANANESLTDKTTLLTPLQQELFCIVNNYQDLYFPLRSFENANEIRFVYCLHAVNHILKTRTKVLHHNAKLSNKADVPEEYRDQGLVRPKVLIILPFKNSAYKVIMKIIDILLPNENSSIIKKNRFVEDYTGNDLHFPKKNPKPEDYERTFTGNTDDNFRIGLSVTKKSIKLYSDFYTSDIIVASPLGLRTIIGAEGESDRDFDFLSSIELLILDQTEIFLMQNWDHLIHVFNHIHLKPKDLHGTDVSRVRQWSLNFWAKYYRQTLIFSSVVLPEINSIFNKKCFNYAGKAKVLNAEERGSLNQVFVQVPHVFHRLDTDSPADAIESRFQYFVDKILPQQRGSLMKQTLVYIPSYFDYVRIRNYFKKEDISFVQICEYSKDKKVARARDMFFHGDAHFLLYTERHHFYHRIRVKGIRHIVFYQPPNFPQFYSELCNLMQEANMNKKQGSITNMTVTVIYSKYDIMQLSAMLGTERAAKISQSEKKVHMIVTGAD